VHSFGVTNICYSHPLTNTATYTTTDRYLSYTEYTHPNGNFKASKYGHKSASCNSDESTSDLTANAASTASYAGSNKDIAADCQSAFLYRLLKPN
jgi:hypothetical protein